MAEEKQLRAHPEFAAVVLFLVAGGAVWQAMAHGGSDQVPAAATTAEPVAAAVSVSGWVRPVDAELWDGFRTPDNPDHDGVDLGAARGTQVRAAAAGVVVRAKCDTKPASWGCDRDGSPDIRGCGWYVDIRHAGDVYTRYCHLGQRPDVVVDQAVTAGQVVGVVGSTGNSSAPHLHFEVHLGDESSATATDPVAYMAGQGAPLGTG